MHIALISIELTVSELKQPWSELLQRKNLATLRWNSYYQNGETLVITENYWTSLNTYENLLT